MQNLSPHFVEIQNFPNRRSICAMERKQSSSTCQTPVLGLLSKIIPELSGKLDGISVRVPTPTVSLLDLVVEVKDSVTIEQVNQAFAKASESDNFKEILKVVSEQLVSSDFKGDSYSSIIDLPETKVNGNMIKVISWYDNEWGYSCRLAEFAEFVGKKIN